MAQDSTRFGEQTNQIPPTGHYKEQLAAENRRAVSVTFEEFYTQHVDQVYRYLLVRTGDVQVAQDLTSDTFFAALLNFELFRGESSLATWVLGIARHKLSDHYRKQRNHLPLDTASSTASTVPSPEKLAEQQWQLSQVAGALRMLAPNRANALALHIFAGLSIEETSQVLEKSSEATKMLIYRAIQDLRLLLAAEAEE